MKKTLVVIAIAIVAAATIAAAGTQETEMGARFAKGLFSNLFLGENISVARHNPRIGKVSSFSIDKERGCLVWSFEPAHPSSLFDTYLLETDLNGRITGIVAFSSSAENPSAKSFGGLLGLAAPDAQDGPVAFWETESNIVAYGLLEQGAMAVVRKNPRAN